VIPPLSLSEALASDALFGPWFKHPSWNAWKALLAALLGEPLSDEQAAFFRAYTGRQALPAVPFDEAGWVIGRRGGKSRALATLALYLALFRDYTPFLVPGELATVAVLSATTKQARAILRYAKGMLDKIPVLAAMVVDDNQEVITFSNGVVIEVGAASFRTVRGSTIVAALCDEIAFWRNEETSANPDIEILRALRPAMATIPNAVLVMSSSPYARKGELHAAWRRYYARDDAPTLVWQASTKSMNPTVSDRFLARKYEEDAEAAKAEFGAQWRNDLADFVSDDAVDAVTAVGRTELPPMPGVAYAAFGDPSGGVRDAMTLAVAHLEGDIGVLDCVLEIRPPFDPSVAVAQCVDVLRRYGISRVVGDHYAGQWPVVRFKEHGIVFEQCARAKSDLYLDALALINARRVELLDNRRLYMQLVGLERRTARSGRDSVDHAPNGTDDLANSVCGVLVGLDLDRRPALIKRQQLLDDERPVEPRNIYGILGLLWVTMDGMAAWAISGCAGQLDAPTQVLLDYAMKPWSFEVLDEIAARMDEEAETALAGNHNAKTRGTGIGSCLLVPTQLQGAANLALAKAFSGHAEQQPWYRNRRVGADALEDSWFDDLSGTMLTATAQVGQGRVKLSPHAAEKAGGVPLLGSLSIKAGEDIAANPLRLALMVLFAQLGEAPARPNPSFGTARIEFH